MVDLGISALLEHAPEVDAGARVRVLASLLAVELDHGEVAPAHMVAVGEPQELDDVLFGLLGQLEPGLVALLDDLALVLGALEVADDLHADGIREAVAPDGRVDHSPHLRRRAEHDGVLAGQVILGEGAEEPVRRLTALLGEHGAHLREAGLLLGLLEVHDAGVLERAAEHLEGFQARARIAREQARRVGQVRDGLDLVIGEGQRGEPAGERCRRRCEGERRADRVGVVDAVMQALEQVAVAVIESRAENGPGRQRNAFALLLLDGTPLERIVPGEPKPAAQPRPFQRLHRLPHGEELPHDLDTGISRDTGRAAVGM